MKTVDIEQKNESKVIIKIPLESGGFWQKEYYQNDLIETVVKDFKEENNVDIPEDYFIDWNFKNKPLKMSDKIKTLINQEIPTLCINQEIKKKPLKISNEEIIQDVVGKPFNDPFEVFLFAKEDKSLKIQTYDPTTVKNLFLNNYSPSSAYCNGNNHLFISGGEKKNGEIIDNFWEIDLKDQNIAEPVKIPPKKNHSMIFIPNNYVFVVGGNDKKTFYFNTQNAEICEWADLNILRTEPALQRISNNLYCLDNINKGNNDIFSLEKTDLNSNKPEWILLTPKFNFPIMNEQKLSQKFFGVSKDDEDNIIFLGGNMDNYNNNDETFNYKYNTNLNTVELSKVPYRRYNFKEKTFLTYKKNIDYILPDFNKQHPEVVFFVKKNNKIEAIDYEPKMNPQLKSLKPPMTDFKYDFNMPMVAIPDQATDFNFDQQNQVNTEKQNIFNTSIKINNNEPSFQDHNFKNIESSEIKPNFITNNKMDLPTNFKEPEIQPMKEDVKLSLEINNDMLRNKGKINLRNKDDIDNINANLNDAQFNKVTNPEFPVEPYNTNIISDKNGIPDSNLQLKVNIPQNEINLQQNSAQFGRAEPNLVSGSQLNNNKNNNFFSNTKLNDIITSEYKINNNVDGVDLNVPKLNLEGNKKGNRNIDMSISGVILGSEIPNNNKINNKIDFTKNINITGTIQGIKTKKSKTKNEIYLSGDIPGVKQNGAKTLVPNPNININSNAKENLNGPKINYNNNGINKNIGEINMNGPSINVESPNINLKSPNYNISGNIPSANIKKTNIDIPSTNINYNNKKIPNFNLSGNIPGKVSKSKNQFNYNINTEIPNVKRENPKIDLNTRNLEINAQKSYIPNYNISGNIQGTKVNTSNNNISLKNANKKKDFNLTGIIPGKKQNKDIDTNLNIQKKNPDYNLYGNIPGKGTNNKINISSSNISINEQKKNVLLTGVIPGTKIKAQKVDIPEAKINLKGPKVNVPNLNLSENIPEINSNIQKESVKANSNINLKEESQINIPNHNLTGAIPEVKINEPKIDLNANNLNYHLNGPKIQANNNDNIENNTQLKMHLTNPKVNSIPPEIKGTNLNIKGNLNESEIKIPKIEIPNDSINLNLNNLDKGTISKVDINNPNINIDKPNLNITNSIPEYNLTGVIKGSKIEKNSNKNNKNINLTGTILGKKIPVQDPINLRNPNIKHDQNIQLSSSQNVQKDISIKGSIQNVNTNPKFTQDINVPLVKLQPGNIDTNPLNVEFGQGGTNLQNKIKENALDYNMSGNIPGVKVTKLNQPKYKDFFIEGLIPPSKNKENLKSYNYKINSPDVQLSTYTNNNINGEIILNKSFHGNINDPYNLDINNNEIKASRRLINMQPPSQIHLNNNNNNNNINLNKSNNVNLNVSNLQILPEKSINLSNSQNIIQKSNNEYYPPRNDINPEIKYNYDINNHYINSNLKKSNFDYKIENNLNNKPIIQTNISNEQYAINGDDIHIQMPKIDINYNNNINEMPTKDNRIQNNHKLNDLRFRTIDEEKQKINNINFGEENEYSRVQSGINRGNSKKKNNELPPVGIKSNSFKSSKIEVAGNLNRENIDINNIKSTNVGVNGMKIGDRIIE